MKNKESLKYKSLSMPYEIFGNVIPITRSEVVENRAPLNEVAQRKHLTLVQANPIQKLEVIEGPNVSEQIDDLWFI